MRVLHVMVFGAIFYALPSMLAEDLLNSFALPVTLSDPLFYFVLFSSRFIVFLLLFSLAKIVHAHHFSIFLASGLWIMAEGAGLSLYYFQSYWSHSFFSIGELALFGQKILILWFGFAFYQKFKSKLPVGSTHVR